MIDKGEKWIVIDLNPNREILPQIAGEFYENKKSKRVFLTSKFSISFKGFGLTIEGKEPVSNIETVIEKILTLIKDNGFKVLFTIDEVSRNRYLRSFIHDFQSFLRNDYPVYLLMTGLYENVDFLKDSKNLTFLYRAPKIDLKPLNIELIKKEYRKAFPSEKDETIAELSLLTKGYAFAYQVAGFLFDKFKDVGKIHKDFDQYLKIYAYDKIWESLPNNEKQLLASFGGEENTTKEALDKTEFNLKEYSVYRDRLIKRGVINGDKKGVLKLVLPRFYEFIKGKIS